MIRLLFGQAPGIIDWLKQRLPDYRRRGVTIAIAENDRLIAVCAYSGYNGVDVDITIAADSPAWCRRDILAALFGYPFRQLHCRRVTVQIEKPNRRARRLAEGLGFTYEGKLRRGAANGNDVMIYGMLRKECRWMEDEDELQRAVR